MGEQSRNSHDGGGESEERGRRSDEIHPIRRSRRGARKAPRSERRRNQGSNHNEEPASPTYATELLMTIETSNDYPLIQDLTNMRPSEIRDVILGKTKTRGMTGRAEHLLAILTWKHFLVKPVVDIWVHSGMPRPFGKAAKLAAEANVSYMDARTMIGNSHNQKTRVAAVPWQSAQRMLHQLVEWEQISRTTARKKAVLWTEHHEPGPDVIVATAAYFCECTIKSVKEANQHNLADAELGLEITDTVYSLGWGTDEWYIDAQKYWRAQINADKGLTRSGGPDQLPIPFDRRNARSSADGDPDE